MTALVVSNGDDALLELPDREAWHFPRRKDGTFSGHHPADGPEVISELERLQREGAGYLVVPATSTWWLDHYEGLRRYLEEGHLADRSEVAVIYELGEQVEPGSPLKEAV